MESADYIRSVKQNDMKQDLDISNIESKPTGNTGKFKRDRIRIERKKYDELVAERDRYRSLNNEHFIQLQQAEAARNRLKAENSELMQAYKMQNQRHKGDDERFDEIINTKAAEHAHLDTLARKLRDQRDMARFIAALLLIVSVGFAVAVWIGKLIPVT